MNEVLERLWPPVPLSKEDSTTGSAKTRSHVAAEFLRSAGQNRPHRKGRSCLRPGKDTPGTCLGSQRSLTPVKLLWGEATQRSVFPRPNSTRLPLGIAMRKGRSPGRCAVALCSSQKRTNGLDSKPPSLQAPRF